MRARHGGTAHIAVMAGLVVGSLGLAGVWWAASPRPPLPIGIPLLLATSVIVAVSGRRVGGLVGLVAAGVVAGRLVTSGHLDELRLADGVMVGVARWLQAVGLLVAAASAVALLIRRGAEPSIDQPPPEPGAGQVSTLPVPRRERGARAAQIAGLLVLSAVGAELLAAYNDSTGRPGQVLFAVVFFAGLYGAPALLIREIARRNGWGWPSIILLAFALGIVQPAVIDQALFSPDYQDIEGWIQSLQGTFIEPLGFSATNALNFVLGHVIFSFCAPIAVAEAWRPHTAATPWLGLRGAAIAGVAYILAAALILADPGSHSASVNQLAASLVAAGLCAAAAVVVGRHHTSRHASRRPSRRRSRPAPRLALTVVAPCLLVAAATAGPETWTGAAIATTVFFAGAVLLAHVSRSPDWSVRHAAAVAIGALLSRGLLAFTYYPLIGETSAVRKYTHNVAMLAVVVVAGWIALRRPGPAQGGDQTDPVEPTADPAALDGTRGAVQPRG